MKTNRYETGERDSHGNRDWNWAKVFADLKKVVLGKMKLGDDLYEVMYLRFTIAHYDRHGWLAYYDGNWGELADEIYCHPYGDFDTPDPAVFDDIRKFLKYHHDKKIQ